MKRSRYSESQIIKILKEGESGISKKVNLVYPSPIFVEHTALADRPTTNGSPNIGEWISLS